MLAAANVSNMGLIEILIVLAAGAVGALVKDCLQDGALMLPYCKGGKLYLGFLGGMLVGAFVGIVVDGSFITALLAGYAGTSVIANLLDSKSAASRTVDKGKTDSVTTIDASAKGQVR